jgi:hypothetical protein
VPFNRKNESLERHRGDHLPRRGFLHRLLWAGAVAALAASLTVSNSSAQTTALDRLMRQKLEQSQGMLAAVVDEQLGGPGAPQRGADPNHE